MTKVTLNLFTADVEYLKDTYPIGYTEVIRDEVKQFVIYLRQKEQDRERNRPFDGEVG